MRLWSDLRREWILSTAPSPATGTAAQNTYFHRISTGFPARISMVFHRIFKLFSPLIRQTEIFWRAAVRSPNREIYCVGLIIGRKIGTNRWKPKPLLSYPILTNKRTLRIICLWFSLEVYVGHLHSSDTVIYTGRLGFSFHAKTNWMVCHKKKLKFFHWKFLFSQLLSVRVNIWRAGEYDKGEEWSKVSRRGS